MAQKIEQVVTKVVLIKEDPAELARLINDDWVITSGWNHPKGCLMILQKGFPPKVAQELINKEKNNVKK